MKHARYDGNGNQTAFLHPGGTSRRTLAYDSHNRPERIRLNTTIDDPLPHVSDTRFRYAPDGQRYLQSVRDNLNFTKYTLYPFDGYEVEAQTPSNLPAPATYRRTRQQMGGYGLRQTELGHLPRSVWLHTDRLGSTVAKTNQNGQLVRRGDYPYATTPTHEDRHGFDAFGKPRTGDWRDVVPNIQAGTPGASGLLGSAVTPRGFTGHEHLDQFALVGLIHMNGRVYDPRLGRFLSADPIIQFPANSQSLNPYSYILNNPMSGTDPTGYESEKAERPATCTTGTRTTSGRSCESAGVSVFPYVSRGDSDENKSNGSETQGTPNGRNRSDGSANGTPSPNTIGQNAKNDPSAWSEPPPGMGCYGSTAVCQLILRPPEGSDYLLENRAEGGEFILGFTGAGGTALSVYELITGRSPLSDNPASRLLAAIGIIPFARNILKLGSVTRGADEFVDLTTAQRRRHILDGDATGGGHRPGTGIPGKSEFPQGWSDDRIIHVISDVATDPNAARTVGRGGRTVAEGVRDGVNVRVVVGRDGEIITGFPTNVPRNP